MKRLLTILLLSSLAVATPKLKRAGELLESYREIFPNAFTTMRGSDELQRIWANVSELLPEKGNFSEHTTPAILANQQLANCACRFSGVAAQKISLNELSRLVWNRDLKTDEEEILRTFDASLSSEKPAERFEILCTLLASSLPFTAHAEE